MNPDYEPPEEEEEAAPMVTERAGDAVDKDADIDADDFDI